MRTEIVPATAGMLDTPHTVQAIAVVRGEEVLGVGGVIVGSQMIFARITDALRADRRSLVRAYRRVLSLTALRPLYAHADPEIEGSERLLEHMGFEPTETAGVFVCPT